MSTNKNRGQNGFGGESSAFLIPYVFSLAVIGIPLFFMELAIGESLRQGSGGCVERNSPLPGWGGVRVRDSLSGGCVL